MLTLLKSLKFRQVPAHFRMRQSFTISAIIPHRQCQEVILDNTTDIQIVMQIL